MGEQPSCNEKSACGACAEVFFNRVNFACMLKSIDTVTW